MTFNRLIQFVEHRMRTHKESLEANNATYEVEMVHSSHEPISLFFEVFFTEAENLSVASFKLRATAENSHFFLLLFP